jgi:hypothetical protein
MARPITPEERARKDAAAGATGVAIGSGAAQTGTTGGLMYEENLGAAGGHL